MLLTRLGNRRTFTDGISSFDGPHNDSGYYQQRVSLIGGDDGLFVCAPWVHERRRAEIVVSFLVTPAVSHFRYDQVPVSGRPQTVVA